VKPRRAHAAAAPSDHILVSVKHCRQCVFAMSDDECGHPAAGSSGVEARAIVGVHSKCPLRCGPTIVQIDPTASDRAHCMVRGAAHTASPAR
jgi:hypothetical protein